MAHRDQIQRINELDAALGSSYQLSRYHSLQRHQWLVRRGGWPIPLIGFTFGFAIGHGGTQRALGRLLTFGLTAFRLERVIAVMRARL